jgi:hypothetical protein
VSGSLTDFEPHRVQHGEAAGTGETQHLGRSGGVENGADIVALVGPVYSEVNSTVTPVATPVAGAVGQQMRLGVRSGDAPAKRRDDQLGDQQDNHELDDDGEKRRAGDRAGSHGGGCPTRSWTAVIQIKRASRRWRERRRSITS